MYKLVKKAIKKSKGKPNTKHMTIFIRTIKTRDLDCEIVLRTKSEKSW